LKAVRSLFSLFEKTEQVKCAPKFHNESMSIIMMDSQEKVIIEKKPLSGSIDISSVNIRLASYSEQEPLWNKLIRDYHYLGSEKLLGHRLKYLVFVNENPVAALSFSAPALKLKYRDYFIGWSEAQRKDFLSCLVCNSRFLILPWITIKNLASHVLSVSLHRLKTDWEQRFGKQLLMVETFVDPERFKGTIYKAANWIRVGKTSGSGKKGSGYYYHGKPKEIYLYVLEPNFRDIIGCEHDRSAIHQHPPLSQQKMEELKMLLPHTQWHPGLVSDLCLTQEDIRGMSDELVKFHEQFFDCYGRIEHHRLGISYLSGLISNAQAKSVEPIALEFLGRDTVRSLQRFLKNFKWDHEAMLLSHQRLLSEQISDENGMINMDSSEFTKKGKESVGVARQYCGEKGKVENCQSGVFVGYSSTKGYGLLNSRLYMPEIWFSKENEKRRKDNWVPEDLMFKTKLEIALELVEQVKGTGLYPAKWIGCDATFGSNMDFLRALPHDMNYFAQIKSSTRVFTRKPKMIMPEYKGRGPRPKKMKLAPGQTKARKVSQIAQSRRIYWMPVIVAESSKGPITAEVARIRVFLSRDGLPEGKEQWLFMRKNSDGQIKYAISNAPKCIRFAELVKASTMRWPIEQCFREGKSYLGMGQYEHRSWPAWHRHMIFVFLALHFLLRMRLRFKKNAFVNDPAGSEADCGCLPASIINH
jgi:SRSO17 transposase